MTAMMRAAVLDRPGLPLRLTSVRRPEPGPGEILIRLEASGVCHTDVHVWQGDARPANAPDPFILGHEGVGTVAALGEDVTGWAAGDRAGAAWLHDTCGTCPECREGYENFCQNHRAHGFDVPGTFAEYVVAKADFAVPLPPGDAGSLAPLMCAGLTAHGALDRAGLRHGETCAIFGCGGLGLYAVDLAVRRGARVIAVDPDLAKREAARARGAALTLGGAADLAAAWPAAARADVCINFAPTPATWAPMTAAIRPRGRIVAAAMVSAPVGLDQEWLTATGVTITGTSVGTRAQMRDLMRLHAEDPIPAQLTNIALDEVSDALAALAAGTAPGRFCILFPT